jgi:hypothetical protein
MRSATFSLADLVKRDADDSRVPSIKLSDFIPAELVGDARALDDRRSIFSRFANNLGEYLFSMGYVSGPRGEDSRNGLSLTREFTKGDIKVKYEVTPSHIVVSGDQATRRKVTLPLRYKPGPGDITGEFGSIPASGPQNYQSASLSITGRAETDFQELIRRAKEVLTYALQESLVRENDPVSFYVGGVSNPRITGSDLAKMMSLPRAGQYRTRAEGGTYAVYLVPSGIPPRR